MKTVYRGPVFSIESGIIDEPGGVRARRDIIRHSGSVAVLPVHDDSRITLIRQYRCVFGKNVIELPAGRIDEGETPLQAAKRELREEIGLEPADVNVAGSTQRWLRYRLPAKFVRRHQQPLCIGQKQRWFLLRLAHDDVRFRFDQTAEPEFDEWRWADYWEPVREVIHFKRPVYRRALHELGAIAFPGGLPAYPDWWEAQAQ